MSNYDIVIAIFSLILTVGSCIYFVKQKIFGAFPVTLMLVIVIVMGSLCVKNGLRIVIIIYTILILLVAGMCFALEISMPKTKNHIAEDKENNDEDDGDEYVSNAMTVSAKFIVNEYTREPIESEKKYTNRAMNVTGTISRITNGREHSNIELDGMFLCVCPKGSVKNLREGQKVKITGTLKGKLLLDNCIMIKRPK